jgi:hypothetical protein
MESDLAKSGLGDDPLERLTEGVRVDRLAVLLGDDQAVVLGVGSPELALRLLGLALPA